MNINPVMQNRVQAKFGNGLAKKMPVQKVKDEINNIIMNYQESGLHPREAIVTMKTYIKIFGENQASAYAYLKSLLKKEL